VLFERGREEPLIITRFGRDALVLIPIEEWEYLKRHDPRVGLAKGLTQEWIEAVRNAKVPAATWFAELDQFAGIPFMEEERNQSAMPEPADLFE
jgi:hypothetical protein